MYGRKKRNHYFFSPPGGMESEKYPVNDYYDYYSDRLPMAPVYSLPYPQTPQGRPNAHLPYRYQMTFGQHPNAYPKTVGSTNAYAGHPGLMNPGLTQSVLQNPLQPGYEQQNQYYPQQINGITSMNQYPNQALLSKQPSGIQTLMNSFKAQDGTVDIPKMVNTAGQMVSAISQVQSLVKGLGGILKV